MADPNRPADPGEFELIATYLRPLAGAGAFDLTDDTALLTPPTGCDLILTADAIAAGVHFLPGDPADLVARKALRVNLSDLAAKGASPICYLMTLALEAPFDEAWLSAFADGLAADQAEFGIALAGGDTIRAVPGAAGPLVAITAIGSVPGGTMIRRAGGRPGDRLVLSGAVGGAAAGLACLTDAGGPLGGLAGAARAGAIGRYRLPRPRLALAPALRAHATAAIDVSDGLVGDCDKLAAASGCAAEIDAGAVPLDPALAARSDRRDVVAAAITGGDDFEILAAVPANAVADFLAAAQGSGLPACDIGALSAPADGRAGLPPTTVVLDGRELDLPARAFDHFPASSRSGEAGPGR